MLIFLTFSNKLKLVSKFAIFHNVGFDLADQLVQIFFISLKLSLTI